MRTHAKIANRLICFGTFWIAITTLIGSPLSAQLITQKLGLTGELISGGQGGEIADRIHAPTAGGDDFAFRASYDRAGENHEGFWSVNNQNYDLRFGSESFPLEGYFEFIDAKLNPGSGSRYSIDSSGEMVIKSSVTLNSIDDFDESTSTGLWRINNNNEASLIHRTSTNDNDRDFLHGDRRSIAIGDVYQADDGSVLYRSVGGNIDDALNLASPDRSLFAERGGLVHDATNYLGMHGHPDHPGLSYERITEGYALSDNGHIAFSATINTSGTGLPFLSRGLWLGNPDQGIDFKTVAVTRGGQAPGMPNGTYFSLIKDGDSERLKVTNDGNVVFQADTYDSVNNTSQSRAGIWYGDSDGLNPLVKIGDQLAGIVPGQLVESIGGDFAISDNNQVIFEATIDTGSTLNNRGLFVGTPGDVRMVAMEGTDIAERTYNFARLQLNTLGQFAFISEHETIQGDELDALWMSDTAGNLIQLAETGQLFDVGNGIMKTVNGITLHEQALSNTGVLGYGLRFTDGTSGAFTSTYSAIPEPHAFGIIAIAGFGFCMMRRKR